MNSRDLENFKKEVLNLYEAGESTIYGDCYLKFPRWLTDDEKGFLRRWFKPYFSNRGNNTLSIQAEESKGEKYTFFTTSGLTDEGIVYLKQFGSNNLTINNNMKNTNINGDGNVIESQQTKLNMDKSTKVNIFSKKKIVYITISVVVVTFIIISFFF